jgi:Arc/MetJ-type ribon-helix-helix transcriptional regulator
MDPTEKITVRLTQDTMAALQALVDRGDFDSLAEGVSEAIQKMIESKFTPKELSKIQKEGVRENPINMESLLTDGDKKSSDEAVMKAVTEYVRSKMKPEE